MAKKIRAIMIVEIAGRPAEHVKQSLIEHVGKLRVSKELCVLKLGVSDPQKVEVKQDVSQELYTCYAEIEIEVNDFNKLTELVFDYMPSSIEILEPSELTFNLADATSYLNTLSGRLHKYDEIAKIAQMQVQQLAQRVQMMQAHQAIVKASEKAGKEKIAKKVSKKSNKNYKK